MLLRDTGYHTYMVGKWHLGTDAEHSPKVAGFEESFSLVDGAGTHFDATGFFEGGSIYREKPGDISTPNIDALAEQGLLFTQFHTAPMCGTE